MATIEPRLIHLLNEELPNSPDSSYRPTPDLPPIQSFSSFAKSSNLSLPPLEPDAGNHHGSSEKSAAASKVAHHIPPLAPISEDYNLVRYFDNAASQASQSSQSASLSSSRQPSGGISLRMLYDNPDVNESTHSLNHILEEVPELSASSTEDVSTKKRHRALTIKDDIMQLPHPLKKQKSTQNMMPMPPIINGLYEPPPNAAVFPPIALEDSNEGATVASLNTLKEFATSVGSTYVDLPESHEKAVQALARQETSPTTATAPTSGVAASETEKPVHKLKRKAAKPRKKWSEEETRHLLLGVNKHGVGKWTCILEDPTYRFNGRTAGDLKDRFRTCCPDELRVSKSKESLHQSDHSLGATCVDPLPKSKTKTSMQLEDILVDPEEIHGNHSTESLPATSAGQLMQNQQDSDHTTKPKKSRAHRKKLEDLQAMGIHGPFKKSHRRERRPFTQQDDDQILEGLKIYGPAWTKIQRDPRFDLNSRQPTDLRDRVRNKYPEMYKQIEEKQLHGKDSAPAAAPETPHLRRTSNTGIGNPTISDNSLMTLEPHLNRSTSREVVLLPKWSGSSTNISSGGGSNTHEIPEMDISRLLLEDKRDQV